VPFERRRGPRKTRGSSRTTTTTADPLLVAAWSGHDDDGPLTGMDELHAEGPDEPVTRVHRGAHDNTVRPHLVGNADEFGGRVALAHLEGRMDAVVGGAFDDESLDLS
jgi:hypothetical protein